MTDRKLHLGLNVLSAGMRPGAWQGPLRRSARFHQARAMEPARDALEWDQPLPDWLPRTREQSPGSQGSRDIVLNIARRERLTVRQLLDRVITWHRLVIGSPEQLADAIEEWFTAGAVDGFNLMPDVQPEGIEAFVDHVVPILRDRGLFRRHYEGRTLRDHLGLARPARVRSAA